MQSTMLVNCKAKFDLAICFTTDYLVQLDTNPWNLKLSPPEILCIKMAFSYAWPMISDRTLVQSFYCLTSKSLQQNVSQLFPIQKNVLYNILKVPKNLMWGTHRKWVIYS